MPQREPACRESARLLLLEPREAGAVARVEQEGEVDLRAARTPPLPPRGRVLVEVAEDARPVRRRHPGDELVGEHRQRFRGQPEPREAGAREREVERALAPAAVSELVIAPAVSPSQRRAAAASSMPSSRKAAALRSP